MSSEDLEPIVNQSNNPSFFDVLEQRLSRRQWLGTVAAGAAIQMMPMAFVEAAAPSAVRSTLGFRSVAVSTADHIQVPEGYIAEVFYRWGDAIGHVQGNPEFKPDASNSAQDQALQAGMHHDGIHFFPLPLGSQRSDHGLLVLNHEYTDEGLLHTDGMEPLSAEKVLKSQHAHGVSVIEVRQQAGQWVVVRPSKYARRITAVTPMRIAGPAASDQAMRTQADPQGLEVFGTMNNCAHGFTPWGTYLTCEENWDGYFVNGGTITADQKRNGINAKGRSIGWDKFDERFDVARHPNEANRFGWVVEIDPFDPQSKPVKRTTLGRFGHEGAKTVLAKDGRVVVYLGDDRAFEYIYKFVSRDRYNPRDRRANMNLLDHGTLYVAQFDADGSGRWIALTHGANGLTTEAGFQSQADILIRTRSAGDVVGATKMDRPEWIAVHPNTNEVYCTLTNNAGRGATGMPGVDAANPRVNNTFGQIVRWREAGNDPAALALNWDLFVMAGDAQHPEAARQGNINGDSFGSPDGLWFDPRGVLWIQTDVSTSTLNRGHYERLGNNMMLAADIKTREIRRFLTGPKGCEITGVITTPDARTMFINIQHPGEPSNERSDPKHPKAVSAWPEGEAGGRPRSATVLIRKRDGGVIGT